MSSTFFFRVFFPLYNFDMVAWAALLRDVRYPCYLSMQEEIPSASQAPRMRKPDRFATSTSENADNAVLTLEHLMLRVGDGGVKSG